MREAKGSPLTLRLREVAFGLPVSVCGLIGFPWPVHNLFHAWR